MARGHPFKLYTVFTFICWLKNLAEVRVFVCTRVLGVTVLSFNCFPCVFLCFYVISIYFILP
jgi:hypothetical protein